MIVVVAPELLAVVFVAQIFATPSTRITLLVKKKWIKANIC